MAEDAILAQRAQIEQEIAGRTLCDLLEDNADRHGEAVATARESTARELRRADPPCWSRRVRPFRGGGPRRDSNLHPPPPGPHTGPLWTNVATALATTA